MQNASWPSPAPASLRSMLHSAKRLKPPLSPKLLWQPSKEASLSRARAGICKPGSPWSTTISACSWIASVSGRGRFSTPNLLSDLLDQLIGDCPPDSYLTTCRDVVVTNLRHFPQSMILWRSVSILFLPTLVFGGSPHLQRPDEQTLLMLDTRVLSTVENAHLIPGSVTKDSHNPLFQADKPWENSMNNLYPNVLWDEEERLFKLWYKCVLAEPEAIAKMDSP